MADGGWRMAGGGWSAWILPLSSGFICSVRSNVGVGHTPCHQTELSRVPSCSTSPSGSSAAAFAFACSGEQEGRDGGEMGRDGEEMGKRWGRDGEEMGKIWGRDGGEMREEMGRLGDGEGDGAGLERAGTGLGLAGFGWDGRGVRQDGI